MFDIISILFALLFIAGAFGAYFLYRGWLLLPSNERFALTILGVWVFLCLAAIGYINTHPDMFMAG